MVEFVPRVGYVLADLLTVRDVAPCFGRGGQFVCLLRFEPGQEPAADAFWSVTMYDDQGFQVANRLDRFVLRDRDPLVRGADGSLELYIQHASPGADKEANWLPAPAGPFAVMLRIYSPQRDVLRGRINPPALVRTR